MIGLYSSFADAYRCISKSILRYPVDINCRGMRMAYEISPADIGFNVGKGVSVFSCAGHRVVPIRFILAEYLYILAGRGDIGSIASYNRSMTHFSDDGVNNEGSYGLRLRDQLPKLIEKIHKDISTRQACASIYWSKDTIDGKTHIPCNVFLQVLIRDAEVNLHVISRSSDFVTGFSIDAIHWQMLLWAITNQLKFDGLQVEVGYLYYTLSSLHVYETEREMVDNWPIAVFREYNHFLRPCFGLFETIDNAKKHFTEGLTTSDMASLVGLLHQTSKITELDGLFREHKNKVKR